MESAIDDLIGLLSGYRCANKIRSTIKDSALPKSGNVPKINYNRKSIDYSWISIKQAQICSVLINSKVPFT